MLDQNNKQSNFLFIVYRNQFLLHRAKKKLAQAAKETREQLASLQSKLAMANNGNKS